MSQPSRPVHEIKLGRIRASVWLNEGSKDVCWYSVSVTRAYREGERWKESSSFSRDDLPIVSKVAEMAYRWIWDTPREPTK